MPSADGKRLYNCIFIGILLEPGGAEWLSILPAGVHRNTAPGVKQKPELKSVYNQVLNN
jgi:hypothetical protein